MPSSATATATTELPPVPPAAAATTTTAATGGDAETGHANNNANMSALDLPPEPEIGKGFLKPVPETTPRERLAGTVGVAAVVTAVIAMIVENGSAVVIVAGILSIVVGPYGYYQQTRLTDIRTLQETKRVLQSEVDRFAESNQTLVSNIDALTTSVQRLEEIEQALHIIGSRQGVTVQSFAAQVSENQNLLKQMRGNLQANVLQNLLSVILRSDADKVRACVSVRGGKQQ